LLAAAATALLPLASHPTGHTLTVELCAAEGVKHTLRLPGAPDGDAGGASRCSLCCTVSGKFVALLAASPVANNARAATAGPRIARDRSPARVFAYLPARPRGPPRAPLA